MIQLVNSSTSLKSVLFVYQTKCYPLRTMTHLHNRFCSDFTLHLHECEKRTGLWWAYWALRTLRVTHFLSFNSSHSHNTRRMRRLIRYVLLFSELNRQSRQSDPIRVMWRCPWGLKIMFDCLSWKCVCHIQMGRYNRVKGVECSKRPKREEWIHRCR